jgi:hypothetical protein
MVFFTKKVVIYYMSLKNYFRSIAQDIYEAVRKPVQTATRLKASADMSYGLKILLVSSAFFIFSMFFLSFAGNNVVFVYSLLNELDRLNLNNAVSDYISIIILFLWQLLVGFFIALPVFIVTSFLWMGVYWFIGKRRGGKASYSKFFASMMPIQMVLLLTCGLTISFLSELAKIICAVADISLYKKDTITLVLSLVAMPPVAIVGIHLQSLFIKEIHGISKRDAIITAALPAVIALCLGAGLIIAFMLFATYLASAVPFYG